MTTTKIRNDGKPARRPLPTTPKGQPAPGSHDTALIGKAPSWHELIQPGPKGDRAATLARRDNLGQLPHGPFKVEPLPSKANYAPRAEVRAKLRAQGHMGRFHAHQRRSPKALQVPGARIGMLLIRQRDADRRYDAARTARRQEQGTVSMVDRLLGRTKEDS